MEIRAYIVFFPFISTTAIIKSLYCIPFDTVQWRREATIMCKKYFSPIYNTKEIFASSFKHELNILLEFKTYKVIIYFKFKI